MPSPRPADDMVEDEAPLGKIPCPSSPVPDVTSPASPAPDVTSPASPEPDITSPASPASSSIGPTGSCSASECSYKCHHRSYLIPYKESDLATRIDLWDCNIVTPPHRIAAAGGDRENLLAAFLNEVGTHEAVENALSVYAIEVEKAIGWIVYENPMIGTLGVVLLRALNNLGRAVRFRACNGLLEQQRMMLILECRRFFDDHGRGIDDAQALAAQKMLDLSVHLVDILMTRLHKTLPRIETFPKAEGEEDTL